MGIQISNRRNQVRRTTTAGIVPTIPSSGVTSLIYPDESWADTDLMVGELAMNTVDSRVWFRSDDGIYELGYSGQTGNFLALSDVPNTYVAGSYLVSDGTGLTWITAPTDTDKIVSQTDFYTIPTSADTGKVIIYDFNTTGFTLESVNQSFIDLDDTPVSWGSAEYITMINSSTTALEFVDGTDYYVGISSDVAISGNKTFDNSVGFDDGIEINSGDFIFDSLTISNIYTDTGFTIVNDTSLATTSAIKYYVDSMVYGTSASTYVTLNTTQTISGEKLFSASKTTINGDLYCSSKLYSSDDINILFGDLLLDLTSYHYYGDETTDGSYRTFINPLGYLETQKRISGTWTFMNQI